MDFTGSQGIILACLSAFLIFSFMVLLYRTLRRTPPVGKTRFGFFIEHDYDREFDPVEYEHTQEYRTQELPQQNWPEEEK